MRIGPHIRKRTTKPRVEMLKRVNSWIANNCPCYHFWVFILSSSIVLSLCVPFFIQKREDKIHLTTSSAEYCYSYFMVTYSIATHNASGQTIVTFFTSQRSHRRRSTSRWGPREIPAPGQILHTHSFSFTITTQGSLHLYSQLLQVKFKESRKPILHHRLGNCIPRAQVFPTHFS